MTQWFRYVTVGFAAISVGSPAMAALVAPLSGTIENRIKIQENAILINRADEDSWLDVPITLSTETSATHFPAEGGVDATVQNIEAIWSSADAGSISVDFETLLVPANINQSLNSGNTGNFAPFVSRWSYRFIAKENSLLTFNFDLLSDFTGTDVTKVNDLNLSRLSINGTEIEFAQVRLSDNLFKSPVSLNYDLHAGEQYELVLNPAIFIGNISGRTVFSASQRLSFSIGERPVVAPIPEPTTWAMLIVGFGLIGSFLRRRPVPQTATTDIPAVNLEVAASRVVMSQHMCMAKKKFMIATVLAGVAPTPAPAALTLFQSYVGQFGLSTDGVGSTAASGYQVKAFVPFGATVEAAFLYQASRDASRPTGISFNGTPLSFGPQIVNSSSATLLASARADVTSLVSAAVDGGVGGTYNFDISEGFESSTTEGTALVVIYRSTSVVESTIVLFDGFASVAGDTTTINFAAPLNPLAPGFAADLRLGISSSALGQSSTVRVNGTLMTSNAGNADDGQIANGALITVGGNDDPFSPLLPNYPLDKERYDLAPYITGGDTSIVLQTANPSGDDNLFLAAFQLSGSAGTIGAVPEPATWAMMLGGFGLLGAVARRRHPATVTYADAYPRGA